MHLLPRPPRTLKRQIAWSSQAVDTGHLFWKFSFTLNLLTVVASLNPSVPVSSFLIITCHSQNSSVAGQNRSPHEQSMWTVSGTQEALVTQMRQHSPKSPMKWLPLAVSPVSALHTPSPAEVQSSPEYRQSLPTLKVFPVFGQGRPFIFMMSHRELTKDQFCQLSHKDVSQVVNIIYLQGSI